MKLSAIILTTTEVCTHSGEITLSNVSAMLIVLFFFFLLIIALLLICREPICWYFKINKMKAQQDEIIHLLKEMKEKQQQTN